MKTTRTITVLISAILALGVVAAEAAWDPFFASPSIVADLGTAYRPFGIAAGDFDEDGNIDLVVGRTTGNVAFIAGNGDGTFAAAVPFVWKQAYYNAWAFTAADVNGDGNLDVIWGASASSSGCSVSPAPSPCPTPVTVNDGDVRVFYGNGDGTFEQNTYFVSGVRHNAGTLIARVAATDAGSVAAGDVDGDGDVDVVAGAIDAPNSVVKLLRNDGGAFTPITIVSQSASANSTPATPVYFPAISTQNSPWGLALGDADGDGDLDLFVCDRALYVYLYVNSGGGSFAMLTGNAAVSGRPNVYLGHDSVRAAVGYTASLAAGDANGDGRADVVLGLHSGSQTPASLIAHDGEIVLDVSTASGHVLAGTLADVGALARGVTLIDVNADAVLDIVVAEYDGKVKLLRQLPPLDSDTDGISDYLDNAPGIANAPRIDMNTDGTVNAGDQLDNDADTVLGNPEDGASWHRLGDPADSDDDNDGSPDETDNCAFVSNAGQLDADHDGVGDSCDPLDDRDVDADGVPDGPRPGDSLFELSRAAKAKWASGSTRFVIRIDALGRFFQNEFTQIMTDAAILSPADWAVKCWQNYEPDDIPGYQPCGTGTDLTLPGGKEVPITLITIPKLLWTDPPVVTWINDRNGTPLFELGQHATYHADNTALGDWRNDPTRNFYSCEMCGLTEAENFELLKVGFDTLLGNYGNKWVIDSGATASSPRIDWSTSFWPLLSFSPPYNTSDPLGRKATAQLGFKAFSASIFEEEGAYAPIFSPEGSHHEQFDQFGMFHVSADLQLNPPDTTGDTYDRAAYELYLNSKTHAGGLTTWLIEEVDWSGRPCPNDDRLGTCDGGSNRENNTVYLPRWNAWLQVLDFVKGYPGGVAMTMAEVGLAKGFDNAPTVANADQGDADANGIGDAIDGATLVATPSAIGRNVAGTLAATLANGAGAAIASQRITFGFDADGDGTAEEYIASTDATGMAAVQVTATRPVGSADFSVSWDGILLTAATTGTVDICDVSIIAMDPANPVAGQVTDAVVLGATLMDGDHVALPNRLLTFRIGEASGSGVTDSLGHASASVSLRGPAGSAPLEVSFEGDELYGATASIGSFSVLLETTTITLADAVAVKNGAAVALAALKDEDGLTLDGRTLRFEVQEKVRGGLAWVTLGTALTNAMGVATFTVPSRYVNRTGHPLRVVFDGDASFSTASATAAVFRR